MTSIPQKKAALLKCNKNHYFVHEIENDLICTPQYYKENRKSTHILHLENGEYYKHDCKSRMDNPAHKSAVNKTRAQVDSKIN